MSSRHSTASDSSHSQRRRSSRKKKRGVHEEDLVSMEAVNKLSLPASATPHRSYGPTIQDFRHELRQLAGYTKQLDSRITKLEQRSQHPRSNGGDITAHDDAVAAADQYVRVDGDDDGIGDMFVVAMTHQAKKWVTMLFYCDSGKVRGQTHQNILANFDSGSDFNCIKASLVSARYWRK